LYSLYVAFRNVALLSFALGMIVALAIATVSLLLVLTIEERCRRYRVNKGLIGFIVGIVISFLGIPLITSILHVYAIKNFLVNWLCYLFGSALAIYMLPNIEEKVQE